MKKKNKPKFRIKIPRPGHLHKDEKKYTRKDKHKRRRDVRD